MARTNTTGRARGLPYVISGKVHNCRNEVLSHEDAPDCSPVCGRLSQEQANGLKGQLHNLGWVWKVLYLHQMWSLDALHSCKDTKAQYCLKELTHNKQQLQQPVVVACTFTLLSVSDSRLNLGQIFQDHSLFLCYLLCLSPQSLLYLLGGCLFLLCLLLIMHLRNTGTEAAPPPHLEVTSIGSTL